MPTIGSITKTIRINPRDLEVIEELMRDGTTWSGAIHKLCEGVPTQIKQSPEGVPEDKMMVEKAIYRDIEVMCSFYGVDAATFFKELCKSMNEGEVVYEDGVIKGKSEIDLSRFMEVCHEKKKDPQEVLDRCVMMIGRL